MSSTSTPLFHMFPTRKGLVHRAVFAAEIPTGAVTGPVSQRFLNHDAESKYIDLCLLGFVAQGTLSPRDPDVQEAFRVIDSVEWTYSVLHVRPFSASVVRECLANLSSCENGVTIRGAHFQFDPDVINDVFATPSYRRSYNWEGTDLNQAISILTGYRHSTWTGFKLSFLIPPYHVLYRCCELNWLPGPDTDAFIKKRLLLVLALVQKKKIDFGNLMYDQIKEQLRDSWLEKYLVLPNLIYQVLELQKEIPGDPCDDVLIGTPQKNRKRH